MSRVNWYLRRLRSMDPAEFAWRASRAATELGHRLGSSEVVPDARMIGDYRWDDLLASFRAGTGRPVLLDRDRVTRAAAAHPDQMAAVITHADRVLEGRFRFFGHPEFDVGSPPDWHRDPLTGGRWPSTSSSRIDHRTAAGDPKWIWELHRLQHLPLLAEAWLATGDERYADGAFAQLDSWLDHNPPGVGIAWRGGFEAGIRAISVTVAVQGLAQAPGLTIDRFRRIVRMLDESARRCWRQRSLYSSANNHLVGEMVGLATVALVLPELAAASRWEARALRLLAREAERQILPDGAGAEQSFTYQISTTELLLVVAILLRRRGDEPPAAIRHAVERSAGFVAAMLGTDDPAPAYGDDDQGFALRLGAELARDPRAHLAATAALTGRALAAGRADLTACLLGADEPPDPPVDAAAGSVYADHGGLVVLRSPGRTVLVDVGPLGYLSIAAHGHSDALAVTVAVDGHELIGDPGTGSYYGRPEWRRAHQSTLMHPTVCVDALDQSVCDGPFLWSRHAAVTVHDVDLTRGLVDAEHDGYRRLDAPVVHRRWLTAPPDEHWVVVVDLLDGTGEHEVRASWPLHPALDVASCGSGHVATRDGEAVLRLDYGTDGTIEPFEVRGDAQTDLGWWSRRLEAREPAWIVGARSTAPVPLVIATVLRTRDFDDLPTAPAVRVANGTIDVTWRDGGGAHSISVPA